MDKKIDKKFIEELANNTSIIDFMEKEFSSDFIYSKNSAWANTNCPMPNHEDNSPSFGVNTESNRYHCFGCGETGDIINLIKNVEGLNFAETIQRLALYSGLDIETTDLDLKYQFNELQNLIKDELNYEHSSLYPGGLSEAAFLIAFSKRTKKLERDNSFNPDIISWVDFQYQCIEKAIESNDMKKINSIWKSFSSKSKEKKEEIYERS